MPTKVETYDTGWDPGVRVGLGYNSRCDGWDSVIRWTWYQNTEKTSATTPFTTSTDGDPLFETGVIYPYGPGSFFLVGNTLSGKWKLTFNQIDWELGRKYWLSRCFTLRPYAGVRGAWTKTTLTSSLRTPSEPSGTAGQSFNSADGKITSKLWGVGLLGGIQPNWYFCSNFILYSNFNAALLWGDSDLKNDLTIFTQDDDGTQQTIANNITYKNTKMAAMIDLGLGLRWEETWCCDRYRTALDIGWEHHIWFEHADRPKAVTGQSLSLIDSTGNLIYGGLVVRAQFDF